MAPKGRTTAPNGNQNDGIALDTVDRRLLTLLTDDARTSVAELARQVAMSAPAVRERLGRLEQAGVIRGYRVDIDPAAIGLPVAAWVRVRPGPGQLPKVADLARRSPQVSECHRVTGDDCFLLQVHAPSIPELESVLDGFLLFGQTTTAVVVATPVPPRVPSLHPEELRSR
ncbi:MAG: Lrp/AsnC family transcriptional regulator, leucine-responsive regulatory protein [Pseudonocardiales bacterium]|nr:Lrp/AsnC family transcriptional regulator, leucine-responsive regulatory protein [Pseudonocardiales bacterium]